MLPDTVLLLHARARQQGVDYSAEATLVDYTLALRETKMFFIMSPRCGMTKFVDKVDPDPCSRSPLCC